MDRMIYLTMTGAKAMMQRQDVLAGNLANASTPGFRAELQAFRAVPVRGEGSTTRVFALDTSTGYDPKQGPINITDRALDVAPVGDAWLTVQGLDGLEAYTRAGSLTTDADGTVMTTSGLLVLGEGGPVMLPPDAQPHIGADGTVSVAQPDGTVTPVGRLKLVTPQEPLKRGGDGLFRAAAGEPLPADPDARLVSGALEGSNVNPVETMVSMIAAARQYEMQIKMLQTADRNDQAATRLLSPS